jgi:phosphoribosylamine--glycine ligase
MRVLLVGSGGREHAIGWKLARSPRVDELISLPGNPGLAELGPTVEGIAVDDVGAIAAMARIHDVELVVVGPEAPLAAGAFAKQVMTRAGVPTGSAARFEDADEAREHLDRQDGPFVVKADGLAGGKGVLVTESRRDAVSWVTHWIEQGPVVVEEYLEGPEVSVFAVCTESGAVALEPARDYKRLMEDDQGPNTGGMGAFSPVGDLPPGLVEETMTRVIHPTLNQMRADGNPFTGFLYAGLVLTDEGPKVLEFNVRLGDPETQVILPRLDSDLVDVLEGAPPVWSGRAAVNVVMAAKGYPTAPERGAEIRGLEGDSGEDVVVFHAGTAAEGKKLFVDGGRVLSVVGMGDTLGQARDRAYATADRITWPGVQYRRDIAG